MSSYSIEMRFCRRCGTALVAQGAHHYVCEKGHVLFVNAAPAAMAVLYNQRGQILVIERAIDPGKGQFDVPGGFCDGPEPFEDALQREILEEVGLASDQYDSLTYIGSGIDPYIFGGETVPVVGAMFMARLKAGATPQAADDAATVIFMDYDAIPMDKVYFPSVRVALRRAQALLG